MYTLRDDVVVISRDKVEGSGDWNSPEYQDTTGSNGKKVMNALSFYKMETGEISEWYIAPMFVNGLEAYDGEINLAFDENLISNEFAIKLCLDYEMKKRKKVVKKELIVALRGKLYFVKFIINPKEDDFEPGVILGRSFMRLAKGVVDFGNGVTIIYPKPDPFEDDSEKTGKSSDDCQSLEKNFHPGGHLTQEEAAKEALAIRISQKFALLEEEGPVIETMAYNDKYKKIIDEIWKDKVELDGNTIKEEEDAVKRVKGEALREKDDPGAFIFPIRLERKVNENALEHTTEKPDRHDPNARDNMKQWKKFYFYKCTTSFCYEKDVAEKLSLGWDCIKQLSERKMVLMFTLKEMTTGYDKIQKKDLWLLKDVVRSLSAPIYRRDLDTTTLIDLIDSDGKLIPEDPQPSVPRIGIPRPLRASMQDLYDKMGRMKIRQDAIEQIEEPTTHLAMLSHSMTSPISSTSLYHYSISSSWMMTSSVEKARVGYVTACLVPQTIANADGTSTSTIPGPVTTKEKAMKKNDVKARSMLQKIVSQLAILGENITQEDLNVKFLRSLPSEWNTHVVV
uniref:Uncharacterized protein n=1 Tax=Tanacetum cinerariifolium TaxID=118510 RepID=A0A6L2MP71_TANCI|nr:hypothetical protein [Tanacetum cinerariifolium]